jgi:hypothetical protein
MIAIIDGLSEEKRQELLDLPLFFISESIKKEYITLNC